MAEYVTDTRLHMGYSFELLVEDSSAGYIRRTVEDLESRMQGGWPCWAVSNHDVVRAVSRWGGADTSPAMAAQLVALVCSLRGSVCLYQGEELGLPEAELPYDALQDPYGKAFWPKFKGRDGCRTPMPWDGGAPHAGFSSAAPWLPIPDAHRALAVSRQEDDPSSVLNAARRFLRWRRTHPALQRGAIAFVDAPEPVLAFLRECDGERLLVAFNLSDAPVRWTLPAGLEPRMIEDHGLPTAGAEGGSIGLPARGVFFATLD
jgi:alpha-glucosidase